MSVRVVARIRPLLKSEVEKDSIVEAASTHSTSTPTVVRIPNPKNASETFSFQFNSVYDQNASQQDIFDHEVSPTVRHLFSGFDVTIFAYGVTGTGKTHTMRGGKLLADRGVIPRLLSGIYRRGRKVEKDSEGENKVEVSMSYYEIYNDRVFDLFEPPEKRTPAGLPIRDNNGKTVVAGLTERPCTSLKEFEILYDQANINRSTSATKLNAHSSRSHAVLCVKISQFKGEHIIVSTASAIDLAGSEDNRRTDNDKQRLVESSSINKSLFVLAQCVEAISKGHARVPYRESKMTRILSLGQNNGLTIMILNLAPVRSYHLDTLSSLNFANRTKKIEVREVENEPIYKGQFKTPALAPGPSFQRQPLRPLPTANNHIIPSVTTGATKPPKTFSVYTDRSRSLKSDSYKRSSDYSQSFASRPTKIMRTSGVSHASRPQQPEWSKATLEEMVDKMVEQKLAAKVLNDRNHTLDVPLSNELQRRLNSLEQRVGRKEDERAEGLHYLLMAKQHHVRGEDVSALKMYQLAIPYFPNNEKLAHKVLTLQEKIHSKRQAEGSVDGATASHNLDLPQSLATRPPVPRCRIEEEQNDEEEYSPYPGDDDDYYDNDYDYDEDNSLHIKPKVRRPKTAKVKVVFENQTFPSDGQQTPRTSHLLHIINTRDLSQIKSLKGVGPRKAEAIVSCLCSADDNPDGLSITGLEQLGALRGVGAKMVENMRSGILV